VTSPPHGGTVPRPTTPAELRKMCALEICYNDAHLAGLLAEPDVLTALLSIRRCDAVYVLAGVLPREQLIEWAQASARRAAEYARAARADAVWADAAARAADSAARAADSAARAAAAARAADSAARAAARAAAAAARAADSAARAAAADSAARAAAEYQITIRHAVQLLGW